MRNIIFLLLFAFALCRNINAEDEIQNETSGALSVSDTLSAALVVPTEGTPWGLLARANKEAKPKLYAFLKNDEFAQYHPNIIRMLGYIGDSSDIPELKAILQKQPDGLLSENAKNTLMALFDAIGLLSRRGIKEAKDFAYEMASVEFWKNTKFAWYPESVLQANPERRFESLSRMMYGYRLANDKDLERLIADILKDINDDGAKQYMEHSLDSNRLSRMGGIVLEQEKAPIPLDIIQAIKQTSSKDTVPTGIEVKDAEEISYLVEIISQSTTFFEQCRVKILAENYSSLKGHIIDNGKIIPAERIETRWGEYEKELSRGKAVFLLLEKMGVVYVDFSIQRAKTYFVSESPIKNNPAVKAHVTGDDLTVSFHLKGSDKAGAGLFSRQMGSLTIDKDGTLIVYLMRIDGKWYWNPFGW